MLRRLLAAVRRFFSRRAARRLLAQRPVRGLQIVLLAVPRTRLPRRLQLGAPLASRVRDLGVADPRKLRIDPLTLALANEGILPTGPNDPSYRWLVPEFRRQYVDPRWMAGNRFRFLGPLHAEWFLMWWEQSLEKRMGAREPVPFEQPEQIEWALDHCKEQMLTRRDVLKDETAPEHQKLSSPAIGHPLAAWDAAAPTGLIPPKQWVQLADPRALGPAMPSDRPPREAYLQWRTLLHAFDDA